MHEYEYDFINAIVFPYFSYCCIVGWVGGGGNVENKDGLYKLCQSQKRAVRMILTKILLYTYNRNAAAA